MFRRPSLEPTSRVFGFDRGKPIDRHYIERYLEKCRVDIRGRVLEVGDAAYTRRFGSGVTQSDVLHAVAGNPEATLVGDLESGKGVPHGVFQCIVLTQVLPVVYGVKDAIATCHAALAAGGVLLVTAPGISQISRYDMDRWGDYWRFTTASMRRLLEESFAAASVEVESYGNVRSAIAALEGLAAEELRAEELAHVDPDYQVLIAARAVK